MPACDPRTLQRYLALGLALAVTASGAGMTADADDAVPPVYRSVAGQYGIPADLFYAMALTESGYSAGDGRGPHPWPWTLNVAGQGRFFATRIDAWRALDATLGDGEDRVDVGLMQINWRYHSTLLKSSWQALEPYRNLRLAAGILKECYRDRHDWWASVGCYHAPANSERARRYRDRVLTHWRSLQEPR